MKVKEFKEHIASIDANYDDYDLQVNFTGENKQLIVSSNDNQISCYQIFYLEDLNIKLGDIVPCNSLSKIDWKPNEYTLIIGNSSSYSKANPF